MRDAKLFLSQPSRPRKTYNLRKRSNSCATLRSLHFNVRRSPTVINRIKAREVTGPFLLGFDRFRNVIPVRCDHFG